MTERYWLYRRDIGPQNKIQIGEERYSALAAARSTLVDAGAFEQKYELLLGNYLAFESWASSCSMRTAVEFDHSYDGAARIISEANRHIMNFLSSSRAYIDQIQQDFRHLPFPIPFGDQAKVRLALAYDGSKEYRFLEALRNFVQHRSLPVHMITPDVRSRDPGTWSESVVFTCLRENIEALGGFKTTVLEETEPKVDLRSAVRQFMMALSQAHIDLRRVVAPDIDVARALFAAAIEDFKSLNSDGATGLATFREPENGEPVGVVTVLLDWDDVRINLAKKNRFPLIST